MRYSICTPSGSVTICGEPSTDAVAAGCVDAIGSQAGNIARLSWLAAGYPEEVPGVTVDRQCGSSQQGAMFAAQAIMAGTQDMVIAAGVESMSAIPLGSARPASSGHRITPRYPSGLLQRSLRMANQCRGRRYA